MKGKGLFLSLVLSAIFLVSGTPLWADGPGGFVYAAGPGVVLGYSFDDATGALTEIPGSPFSVDLPLFYAGGPGTITVDPTGQFLYATVKNPDGIKLFRIDGPTGKLTLVPGGPYPTGDGRPNPFSMAIDPTGQNLYVVNRMDGQPAGSLAVFRIDPNTGVPTPVNQSPPPAPLGASPQSVAVDPTGQYVYVVNTGSNNITAFVRDPATGAVITIPGSPFPAPGDPAQYVGGLPQQLVVRADGQFLYMAIARNPGLIQQLGIDPGGQLRRVINSPFPTEPNGLSLTLDPTGRFLYAPHAFGLISAYTVDFLSGNLFPVPGSPFTTSSANPNHSIAVDPTARFAYVTGGVFGFDGRAAIFGFRIEANGALTPVPGSPVVLPPGASVDVITTTVRRPLITLKINGQHPTPPTVTVTGPTLLTLDVSRGTFNTPVDWYWALYYNGTLYWVTSDGLSTTPAPWFNGPPDALTNVTLLDFTLPPASTITNVVFMVNGTTTVSFDYITATRP